MAKAAEIAIDFSISPYAEMSKDSENFCKKNMILKKRLKDWDVKEKIAANPNKWDKKSLERTLAAVARYELKILGVRVADELKKLQKAKDPKAEIKAIGAIQDHYEKTEKYVLKKIALAIDEIVEDKGDDKKAIKDGKKAFEKIDKFEPDGVFEEVAREADGVLEGYESNLKYYEDVGEVEGGKDKALAEDAKHSASQMNEIIGVFQKETKIGVGAIDFLLKTADKIAKDKNVSAPLNDFGDAVKKNKATFEKWTKEVATFESALKDIAKEVAKGKCTSRDVAALRKTVATASKGERQGAKIAGELKKLHNDFKKVEKELK